MDFVSDALYNGQNFRTLTVIDNFSRRCVAIEVGQSLRGNDVVNTLEQLHVLYGIRPQRIKVDNGPEFISKELDRWAYENKLVGILDHSFKIMNEFITTNFNNENYTERGYILINDFIQTNHTKCIKPISSDTIYKIYPNKVEPYFFIEKGRLAIPVEILSDVSQNNKFKNYITNDYGLIINNLYFMTFYYNNKLYQDIWNIKTSELLYRNIASSANDKYGAPIHINNEIIHVWPIFVDSQSVYCKIDERDQLLLKTNTEDNDILLKIRFEL